MQMTHGFAQHVENVVATVAMPSAAAQSRLAASWCRSFKTYQLHPGYRGRPERLSGRDFNLRKDENDALIHAAGSALDHLFKVLRMSGCAVFLADREGCILDGRSGTGDADGFESCNLSPGADWSEASEGTNGIGTCLSEGRAVTIDRTDHFSARNIAMTCIGAPVFGARGELVGAVDVSSAREDHTPGLNALMAETVAQAARNIEAALFRQAHPRARIVVAETDGTGPVGLLAIDQDDVITGATHAARRSMGVARDTPFAPMPAADVLGRPEPHRGFDRAEYAAVKRALLRAGGNVSAAARDLGVGRATLYRRMKRVGLDETCRNLSQN
ncbi:transcriptional regulator [Dinoroseobacter shibae DFL 12 = DSM 16493]|jgi:transcriptional regulator of acetoin/glycerol metabolism|uniref:Transcriptional regulator n=2 Tax=Dinoroseobacter shibae TaxID=215813 RepID=A8LHN9_DINSH|nr:transcriptional regulator [Dinoroseobacter shibae DFL 12 = DSM 16493]